MTDLYVPPAHLSIPKYERTLGPEVAAICELAGFSPDPEQRLCLDAIFALDKNGKSAAYSVGIICCRQNLKTGLIKMCELGWLFVADERLIVHSAHEFDTASEAFRDLDNLISGSEFLSKRVKRTTTGNGKESIELYSGARIKFKARTKGGGRGLSGGKVVLDEAYALKPEHMGALLPLLSAQPDPQVIYASSAGRPESEVLRGIRDRGRSGREGRMFYAEWCMPDPKDACDDGDSCTHELDVQGCGLDKPEMTQLSNPQQGRRIALQTIRDERRELPPAEFGRERAGWWDDPADGVSVIDAEDWQACAREESKIKGRFSVGVSVRTDGLAASISVAGDSRSKKDAGRTVGELIERRPGTDWVVPRLAEIFKKRRRKAAVLVLDPTSLAGGFLEDLRTAGLLAASADDDTTFEVCGRDETPVGDNSRLHLVGGREYAQACVALVNSIREGTFRHLDQAPLNESVEGARTRPLADAWAWKRKDATVDIAPIDSITLARLGFVLFGHEQSPEPWAFAG